MVRFLKGKRVALQMQQIIPAMLQHEILADILLLESGFQKQPFVLALDGSSGTEQRTCFLPSRSAVGDECTPVFWHLCSLPLC